MWENTKVFCFWKLKLRTTAYNNNKENNLFNVRYGSKEYYIYIVKKLQSKLGHLINKNCTSILINLIKKLKNSYSLLSYFKLNFYR